MNYIEALDKIRTTIAKYKGSLTFGNGTLEELNAQDNIDYPLCWAVQPVAISVVKNASSDIIGQTFNWNLQFLQTGSLSLTQEEVDKLFDETLRIMNGFILKIQSDFDDEEEDTFGTGSATQIYRKQDNVHIGWNLPLTIATNIDNDCCEMFNE